MVKSFTFKALLCLVVFAFFGGYNNARAQRRGRADSVTVQQPVRKSGTRNTRALEGVLAPDPPNLVRSIQYDPATNRYILTEKVGNLNYRPPQYLTFKQYLDLIQRQDQRQYFRQLSDNYAYQSQQPGFVPQINVRSKTFEQIFGSSVINIRPQGSAEILFSGQVNSNQNPLYSTAQRNVFNFNFDQKIQMNVVGNIGDKLKIATNYNTDAQFQFDNQVKLDYTGHADEIIQKIEAGVVSMPLPTTLIQGSQALFGVKTKLKFGKLDVTSVFSQQRSQAKTITITNGAQQGEFRLTPADYEANKHYFLSQYFRNNYDRALANIPIISTNINITKIEVWTTNRTNVTTDSRDILAFLDLGENQPYNTQRVQGGGSALPSGYSNPNFPQQSNNLLQNLPPGARQTNSNDVATYFQSTGSTDNYSKLTYARKLSDKEYVLHPQLGYISLNSPLNNDEVLAVAYRYTYNGVEYQVGEFSTDVAVDPVTPKVLYTKLIKSDLLKTSLPTWKLMMKNIYSLGAYQVSPQNFRMQITRLDEKSGIEKPIMDEGVNTTSKLWLQLVGLDNLNAQNDKKPDGYFDYIEGITIDSQNGRIIFPLVEPFGSDLAAKFAPGEQALVSRYSYQPLYDSTKTIARQYFPQLNRYVIKGQYSSKSGSEFQLNALNIPQGSVIVSAGSLQLTEGTDFNIDYNSGRLTIINQALLSSGQPITVRLENNELFGIQQRSLYGSRFDYRVNPNLGLGATVMHLSETPITQKEVIGEESISNTIAGFDVNYSANSRYLTRLVDKLPLISTKAPSTVTFNGEFAKLFPGSPSALNFAGSTKGTSYLDDFENSRSIIDIKSAIAWQISGTPQLFPESQNFNDLSYGYNRALLAFYNIDPIFYTNTSSVLTGNTRSELSNQYVRQVLETEVFPYKQSVTGSPLILPTLDLAFYPNVRGPYNYTTTGINNNGTLQNPASRWGGIYRKIETNDFESLNVEFISFWVLDPFIYKKNSTGGSLYFDLGSISEDVLKDGRKSLENGLPVDGDLTKVDETAWGRVPKLQPVVNAFDNNPDSRSLQDIGVDGLNDKDEQVKFAPFLNQVKGTLNTAAANILTNDPSSDNYQYYRGPQLDASNAGILQRYSRYNNTEGNSKTTAQSQADLGLTTSAATAYPDGEDINRDNTMSQADEYFEYKVDINPGTLQVGQQYITDKITSQVKLPDGTTQPATWYQFRIPIYNYKNKVGNIEDFKAIRFVRMFMTGFADTTVLRFATLQFERGEWRNYNEEASTLKVIADPSITNPPLDNSTLDVSTVNIEENGNRSPIPYVVPPGIVRQRDFNNLRTTTQLNEQSLSVKVSNLRDGYSRAAYRTFYNDLRSYKNINMFIHAEGDNLKNGDVSAFVRFGVDYQDNYYEYEIPLTITQPTTDPAAIWSDANALDIPLSLLTNAKLARNHATLNGQPWPLNLPYTLVDGKNKVTIKGQPDLSRLRDIMVGVRNPLKTTTGDDGLDKSATVWFDELRLTDFDQRGGWAATARLNAKLADFADVTVAGSKSTIGFGSIEQRVSERSRSDNSSYDVATNVELGKLFPAKSGVHIPMFINVSSQSAMPQYDPAQPDVELKQTLASAASDKERDSIKNAAVDYTIRRSINFTNIHKTKTDPSAKTHLWDIENFNATYAYSEYRHHDFTTLSDLQETYRVALAYNYINQAKYYSPFEKLIKANALRAVKDFNYSLLPTRLNFSINFDRFYSENTLRNNDPNNYIPIPTTFNKSFNITRVYGIGWNLTKSLQLDIDATNLGIVDEPAGRVNGLKKDTLWNNLLKLGRTVNYYHQLNLTYNVPLNKIPGFDFANMNVLYSTYFNWQAQPTFAFNNPDYNVGNTIQNKRTITVRPTLNLITLYNKLRVVREQSSDGHGGLKKFFVGLLTSVKNISGTYGRTEGTYLPGYLPNSNFAGEDFSYNSPGLGFLLGSQADIRAKAAANGWLSTDTLQNQLYSRTLNENLNIRSIIEPLRDLRIELTALRTQDRVFQTNFKYFPTTGRFEELSPITSGDYSISYLSIASAFTSANGLNNTSATFNRLLTNRAIISQRLAAQNPNSQGQTAGYADGYGPNQQNVLVTSFLAAYSGKSASTASLNNFPSIPIPNWYITYGGLSRMRLFSDWFDAIDLKHGYRSTYTVNSFNTLLQYKEVNGASYNRDLNNDFLPYYQFSQITIFEQFVPLLGMDIRFKNSITTNFEYRKSRTLSLSLANSQLAQQNENIIVLGFGYRTRNFRFPFGLFNNLILKNDLNFKVDAAIRDNKTLIYRADVNQAEISSGAKNITFRPTIDYAVNQRFNLSLFYDTNITKPYTSQAFNTAFTNFGVNLKLLLQ
ncbi:T9SS outer membrane translocon Sov/SprA [Mucilaginibacter ginkgonis]|uniref:Cell surface protein SprA n=1 Tax=Mucilaginibacter ginkgonis TaxID=2682091 RepID=A0A6I4HZY6_9SPHI|nr:cell surface protein SprA [Mucilaginibacter ginkgonis]QQL48783.1 cell surface protein SprA [Mucilaginibacter ginkgonis]